MLKQTMYRMTMVILALVLLQPVDAQAQGDAPSLALTAEHDIGFDCPVATAVQPDSDVLWVLMDNCGGYRFSLHAYDLKSGEPLDRASIALEDIDGNAAMMYASSQPMGFRPDGKLEVDSFNNDTYERTSYLVDVDSGVITSDSDADKRSDQAIRQYSDYPEQAIYSPDRAYAVAVDDAGLLHVLDMVASKLLFKVEATYGQASFSPDSRQLYVAVFDEPDNMDNPNATLSVYDLPNATAKPSVHLPTAFVYPSPDGRYLAAQIGDSQLGVVEVATGKMSSVLEMWEKPGRALTCENDGRSLSDVDFPRSGRLTLTSVQWLPDSSGFYTVNSYGGEAAGGGRPCFFNHSRLRQYVIENT